MLNRSEPLTTPGRDTNPSQVTLNISKSLKKKQTTHTQIHGLARPTRMRTTDFTRVHTMHAARAAVDSCFVLLGLISTVQLYCEKQ